MRYVINKFVDAVSVEEALKKAKLTPIHEVFIHNDSWKESGYSLKEVKNGNMGFKDKSLIPQK